MTSRTCLPMLAVVVLAAGPAAAGELALELHGGYFGMAAKDSASAVFDSAGGGTFGGAVRYTFWRGAFAAAGVRTFSKDGERVFVHSASGPVFELGFPLSLRVTPIFVTVGYRFREGRTLVPYGGLGGSITRFREESDVTGAIYEESRSKAGFHALAGVEVGSGQFRFGAEAVWSTVPDAVGLGGVSKTYGEDDLGGFTFLGKLIVAFGL